VHNDITYILSLCRSQSDTSQSFSAELDAVYRLYCREYELQLQLQQQQLELQKQQLQLQQQLQQLELFQQRQQTQQQTTASINQVGFCLSKSAETMPHKMSKLNNFDQHMGHVVILDRQLK